MDITKYLDNTAQPDNWEDLGILRFARELLVPCQENRQAYMHYEMMKHALDLYNPKRRFRPDRQMYNLVHREGAKSTYFSFVFPLYVICTTNLPLLLEDEESKFVIKHQGEFILICSETGSRATQFVANIRTELSTNRVLTSLFGDQTPRNVDDPFLDQQWTRNLFKTTNGCVVAGLGTGMQVRGISIGGKRPSLAVCDDLYSAKGVLTEETREKTRYWFGAEMLNSIDSQKGKVILVGTIVHEDTVLVDVQKQSTWYGFKYPLISQAELSEALSYCRIDYDHRSIDFPAMPLIESMNKKFESISWKERFPLYYIMSMYKDRFEGGRLHQFYQEMLHILQSPDDEVFTDTMVAFIKPELDYSYDNWWASFDYDGRTWKGTLSLCIGVDIASGETDKSDNTAIYVCGYCHAYPIIEGYDAMMAQNVDARKRNGITFPILLDGFAGKTDVYDSTREFGTTVVHKKGIVNIVERFVRKYKLRDIAVECAATQALIARELRRYFTETKRNDNTLPSVRIIEQLVSTSIKKKERIESTLLPVFQSAIKTLVAMDKQCLDAWTELKLLGVGAHDDRADAVALAFQHARKGLKIDYQTISTKQEEELARQARQKRKNPYPDHHQISKDPKYDWETS